MTDDINALRSQMALLVSAATRLIEVVRAPTRIVQETGGAVMVGVQFPVTLHFSGEEMEDLKQASRALEAAVKAAGGSASG